MKAKRRPIHRAGVRNIGCPVYTSCLDHAAKHYWQYWDCSECAYKMAYKPIRLDPVSRGFDPLCEMSSGTRPH